MKIVMYDSPEAAQILTVTGRISRNGKYYGENEHAARYDGCTHRPCRTCGEPAHKHYTLCDPCRGQHKIEKYNDRPRKKWDGVSMLFSEMKEEFYIDLDAAEECLEDEQTLEDLRLVICDPNYIKTLEPDFFCDDLAPEDETPKELLAAIAAFNAAVANMPPLSWSPGKYALKIDEENHDRET